MPLLDHFHPPLAPRRRWSSFLARWAMAMADALNLKGLPPGYFAEIRSRLPSLGASGEVFEDERPFLSVTPEEGSAWSPPAPTLTLAAWAPDEIAVLVYSESEGDLVAAVEIVSPGNKDRAEARRAFAARCDFHLQRRVGLVIIDVVTEGKRNLHDELMRLRLLDEAFLFPDTPPLYAAAYRPVRRKPAPRVDVWLAPLSVGATLPTLPLAVRGAPILPLDLEATYMGARRSSRLA